MEKIEEDLLSPAVIAKFHKRFKDDDYDLNDVILRSYEIGRLRGRKDGYITRNDEVQPIFEWLLGHTDFPARKDREGAYYWRKELRKKLNKIGLTINPLKTTLIVVAMVGMVSLLGCGDNKPDELKRQEIAYPYQILTIDSCQYIDNKYRSDVPIVHKGNCNNPIHKTH